LPQVQGVGVPVPGNLANRERFINLFNKLPGSLLDIFDGDILTKFKKVSQKIGGEYDLPTVHFS